MTSQEEELLVQIIVRCVREVLEHYPARHAGEALPYRTEESQVGRAGRASETGDTSRQNVSPAPAASHFIDIVPRYVGGYMNGNGNRDEMRKALQRFMRDSEQRLLNGKARANEVTPSTNGPAASKRDGAAARAAESQSRDRGTGARGSETPATPQRQLITQADILAAHQRGQKVIELQPDAIVTPLARQIAKEKGVELR